jgi:hypothetical protein
MLKAATLILPDETDNLETDVGIGDAGIDPHLSQPFAWQVAESGVPSAHRVTPSVHTTPPLLEQQP